jgi:putative transposase
MKYNPDIHRRRLIRLPEYDCSRCGYYFITVCTRNRRCLFGQIEKGRMILNDAGKMIDHWWNKLKTKCANIEIDEYVVMPNHCHGVINIVKTVVGADGLVGADDSVGADPRVCPPVYKMVQWFKTMTTNEYIRNVKQNSVGICVNPRLIRWYHSGGDRDNHPLIPRQGRGAFIRDPQYNMRSFVFFNLRSYHPSPMHILGSTNFYQFFI